MLESVLRNCDGKKVAEKDVETLAAWNAKTPAQEEIPFVVARIVLQDFTGVPLLVDLAAMRTAVATLKKDPKIIEPLVPVDLVVQIGTSLVASTLYHTCKGSVPKLLGRPNWPLMIFEPAISRPEPAGRSRSA